MNAATKPFYVLATSRHATPTCRSIEFEFNAALLAILIKKCAWRHLLCNRKTVYFVGIEINLLAMTANARTRAGEWQYLVEF